MTTSRDDIIKLTKSCGINIQHPDEMDVVSYQDIEAFFHAAQAAEREECAKLCAFEWDGDADTFQTACNFNECADAIRNRSKTNETK